MKKRIMIFDILALAGIAVFLLAVELLHLKQYFFNFAYIALLSFYYIGKAAAKREFKISDKKFGRSLS